MTTLTEITQRNHHRAVRFFWCFLIGATTVSLVGNITHAVLTYIPRIVIQIGAAAVPPIALLAAVHGIATAVRAGASGKVYCWAVSAVATIGVGAFSVSFLALRDLMRAIGYSSATAVGIALLATRGELDRLPTPPKRKVAEGRQRFTCPRCGGASDIPDTDTSYECWQCGEVRKVKPKVTGATKGYKYGLEPLGWRQPADWQSLVGYFDGAMHSPIRHWRVPLSLI